MFRLFRKKKLGAAVSRTRQIEEQIEKIRKERGALEDQIVKEREKSEKSFGKRLLQKEKDDLAKADKILRARPIHGEDPLHDLRELSKMLSHIVGISDDGEHLREKEDMLARAADWIAPRRALREVWTRKTRPATPSSPAPTGSPT